MVALPCTRIVNSHDGDRSRKKPDGVILEGVGVEVHLYPKFQKCARPADRSQSKSQSKSKSKPKPNEGVSKILGGGKPPKILDTPLFGFGFDFDFDFDLDFDTSTMKWLARCLLA